MEPLRALLAEDRDDGEVNYLYGRALALTGMVGLAEWSLQKAMQDPEWLVPAGLQLAYGELAAGNNVSAIETTTQILAVDPENVEALVMRANARTQSRLHHEEALVDVEPGSPLLLLMGRLYGEPHSVSLPLLEREFSEIGRRFTGVLSRALPDVPLDVLRWRFHFVVGAMIHLL